MIAFPNRIHFKFIFLYIYLPGLGLSCSLWDLGPWPRIEPGPPVALGVWSLRHWTTRKVPEYTLKGQWEHDDFIFCLHPMKPACSASSVVIVTTEMEEEVVPRVAGWLQRGPQHWHFLSLFSAFLMNSAFQAQVSPHFLQPWAQPVPSPLISLPLTQPLFIFGTCPPANRCWLRGSDDNPHEDASFPSVGMHLGRWCHSTSSALSLDPRSQARPGSTVYSETIDRKWSITNIVSGNGWPCFGSALAFFCPLLSQDGWRWCPPWAEVISSALPWGFPGGVSGIEPACQCRRLKKRGFDPWVGKIPRKRKWQPTPVFLPGESQGQRRLVGYSPWGHKSQHDWSDLAHTRHSLEAPSATSWAFVGQDWWNKVLQAGWLK